MSRFKKAFNGRKNVFLVAIHVSPDDGALVFDVEVAWKADVDGIIVIKDYTTAATDDDVKAAYTYARKKYRSWWIGVNLLDHMAHEAALRIKHDTSGLWIDDSRVAEDCPEDVTYLAKVQKKLQDFHFPTVPLLLASVAFKYQASVNDPAAAAKLAAPHCDVVVTSGIKTGIPPTVEKVKLMADAATPTPLGIASGITSENVAGFMAAGARVFIVNTGISINGRLDLELTAELARKIHA